jgi:hypothetical protein
MTRRTKRPRKYVAIREKWAAALSMLLPQAQRDELRERRATAKEVIALFDQDHVVFHAIGGPDRWWNFTPMLRAPHKEKSRRDTSAIAKVRRLEAQHEDFRRRVLAPDKKPRVTRDGRWPKGRKLQSRGFERREKASCPTS